MKKAKKLLGLLTAVSLLIPTLCYADNPVVQTNYTADPAPMVHGDTLYLYTSHDEDVTENDFYTMKNWKCYSTTDMQNWTDHGTILGYTDFSWAKGDAWAWQVVERDGKFYAYVPLTQKNGAYAIGVAVSDSPTGPFVDPLGKPLATKSGSQDIDPTCFIDDDGQAYLYWGNGNLYMVKLNKDMISYSGSVQTLTKPDGFIEGPWVYKLNNMYYLVYAGWNNGSENLQYATSNSPTGPWTARGAIMGGRNSFTNHPGVARFKGNDYLFYHTGDLPGGGSYKRSVCVEQFKYSSDGKIPNIPMTKNGPTQIKYLNPFVKTEAETFAWGQGVETESCGEGGMAVSFIENGDYLKINGVDFGTGATSFQARVSSANSGGNIEIRLDSPTGTLVGTCAVKGTGAWQTYADVTCNVTGATGVHDLYLKFTGGSGYLFNFNNWKFNGTPTQPTVKYGDVDGSGSIDAIDFAQIKQYLLGSAIDFTADQIKAADVDGSGTVDAIDFALVKQYLLRMIDKFPAEV